MKAHPKLVTLGVRPSRPETGYGYIQFTDCEDEHFVKVKTFTEKPNIEMAKVFYESGEFLWNSGCSHGTCRRSSMPPSVPAFADLYPRRGEGRLCH